MTDAEQQDFVEDIELDEESSDAVLGGRATVAGLEAQGWIAEACTKEGTEMFNPKTKQRRIVAV